VACNICMSLKASALVAGFRSIRSPSTTRGSRERCSLRFQDSEWATPVALIVHHHIALIFLIWSCRAGNPSFHSHPSFHFDRSLVPRLCNYFCCSFIRYRRDLGGALWSYLFPCATPSCTFCIGERRSREACLIVSRRRLYLSSFFLHVLSFWWFSSADQVGCFLLFALERMCFLKGEGPHFFSSFTLASDSDRPLRAAASWWAFVPIGKLFPL